MGRHETRARRRRPSGVLPVVPSRHFLASDKNRALASASADFAAASSLAPAVTVVPLFNIDGYE